jgi:hypothetical protein
MINRTANADSWSAPILLRFTDLGSYLFTVSFIALNIVVPWIFHQVHLAGPTFLPMQIFVLAGGLLFGWRAGLVIGLFTPIVSYAVSGMPFPGILVQTTMELSAYGLITGLLRERFRMGVFVSLLGAMAGGRLVLLLAAAVIYLVSGASHNFAGPESNPFLVVWSAIWQGWPGILIQIISIPLIICRVEKSTTTLRPSGHERSCL